MSSEISAGSYRAELAPVEQNFADATAAAEHAARYLGALYPRAGEIGQAAAHLAGLLEAFNKTAAEVTQAHQAALTTATTANNSLVQAGKGTHNESLVRASGHVGDAIATTRGHQGAIKQLVAVCAMLSGVLYDNLGSLKGLPETFRTASTNASGLAAADKSAQQTVANCMANEV